MFPSEVYFQPHWVAAQKNEGCQHLFPLLLDLLSFSLPTGPASTARSSRNSPEKQHGSAAVTDVLPGSMIQDVYRSLIYSDLCVQKSCCVYSDPWLAGWLANVDGF